MFYGQIKRAVLERINQYSVAGETVSPAYNNQSDYIQRIPNLINFAVRDIRDTVKPSRSVTRWKNAGDGWLEHKLPDDFLRIFTGSLRRIAPGLPPEPTNRYTLLGKSIWVPPGDYALEYDRRAAQLPEDPQDGYDLPEEEDVIQAAVLYAAAGLVMMESEYAYAALSNEYEARKAAMRPAVTVEIVPLADSLPALWDFC